MSASTENLVGLDIKSEQFVESVLPRVADLSPVIGDTLLLNTVALFLEQYVQVFCIIHTESSFLL